MAEARMRSLRTRITLLSAVIVAVVLVGGALVFYAVLAGSIRDAAARSAETRVEELAARVEASGPGAVTALEDDLAQIVDDGAVLTASEEAGKEPLPDVPSGSVVDHDGDSVLIVRESVGGGRDLLLGIALDDDAETLSTVAALLAVSVPLVVAVVAGLTWWVVGRALAPVARIRTEVDDITADRLDRRVAVPGSRDEIAALATTMNRMLTRLDDAAAAQRQFVSDASHELRSPLATIRQHAELAQAHPEVTSVGDLAEVVHDEGLRMQGLVDSLLLLARLDEGARSPAEPVDLDDLALAEAARLRAAGGAVDAAGISAARVAGDARLFAQLVRNLADNAARHARSRVALSTRADGGRAYLMVDDDGTGIAERDRERVFERFVRLDEARARDAGGSGLGLAIVRAIANASGGSVAVSDSPLGGARFTVQLPAAS
ncbi:sensor histidine kinase [Microbacterium sp. RD1]|uniref:sensor histidine kinase n=1 Tax=Microbacterium sp. RD1 TaxID=3457313 RepID=UPI003FA59B70